MNRQDRRTTVRRTLSVAAALIFAILLTEGCAYPYGHLQRNDAVTQLFRSNSVPETYRYYIDGRTGMPNAIVGIDPQFELVPHYWEPVKPNSEDFARKVVFIWLPQDWTRYPDGQGAYIVDRQGNRIGIWYSMYAHTTIVVHPDRRVEIYSPALGEDTKLF